MPQRFRVTGPAIPKAGIASAPVKPSRLSVSFCSWPVCLFLIVTVGQIVSVAWSAEDRTAGVWLTGTRFHQELQRPFSASWTHAELRQMFVEVAADRRVSIILDRRINPSAEFPFEAVNVSLQSGLTELADLAKGELCLTENVAYVGPKPATKRLRTLIELRKSELSNAKQTSMPDRRRSELQRHQTIEWHDLDTPRQILDNIAAAYQIRISNPDVISHDLWAAGTIPDGSLAESLSIILIQFDLTFRVGDAGSSIELIPIPDTMSVERKHHSRLKPAEAIKAIHDKFPDLEVKSENGEILVRGLIEDQEAVAGLLRGDRPTTTPKKVAPQPIRRQLFTLTIEQPVPLSALMKKLEESDIHFDYNASDLKSAGIDLEQTIQFDVKKMPGDEFMHTIFDGARLDFQIDGMTVKLKPKRAANPNK